MTSLAQPNEWPCLWLKCQGWCVEAAETSVLSSSAPKTSLRLPTRSRGWPKRLLSSALTSVSGPTCSRSVHLSSEGFILKRGYFLIYIDILFAILTSLPGLLFRCVSVFPPSALSWKFCPRSRPPCWVVPTSVKRSLSRWVLLPSVISQKDQRWIDDSMYSSLNSLFDRPLRCWSTMLRTWCSQLRRQSERQRQLPSRSEQMQASLSTGSERPPGTNKRRAAGPFPNAGSIQLPKRISIWTDVHLIIVM